MSEVLAILGVLFAAAVVFRTCKACWARTEHYKIDASDGDTIYKCSECGFSYREKNNG